TKQYEKLKNDLAQAKLSQSLESRQKGSQFVIVDPANYPLNPAKPSKRNIALGGLAVSLFVGIAFAVAVEIAKEKIWTHSEIEGLLGATVLVEIPEILSDSDIARTRRKRIMFVASSLATATAYGLCLYLLYIHQASFLRYLDPLLQRLYS